jgi:hypothetical protein
MCRRLDDPSVPGERDAGGRLDACGGDTDLPHELATHRGLEDVALPVTHDQQVVIETRSGDALI